MGQRVTGTTPSLPPLQTRCLPFILQIVLFDLRALERRAYSPRPNFLAMSIGLSETVTIGRKSEMIATQMIPRGMMYPLMSVDVSAMFASVYLIVFVEKKVGCVM